MKKLILTSLGIISISLLFLTLSKKETLLEKNNLSSNFIQDKDKSLNKEIENLEKENLLVSNVSTNNPKRTITTPSTFKQKEKIEKESFYIAYLNYRKEQHQQNEKKMNQYLNHQKELRHIREGGVKSKIQREKKKHEVEFQHQYKSSMMSQRSNRQESFMKQKRKIERRREHMQSLKERQQLQTKYRGEL